MGLFLPVLLLGLTQPADQPPVTPQSHAQVQTSDGSAPVTSLGVDAGTETSDRPFDRIEPYRHKCDGDPDCKARAATRCLTIRSYYFERRDDLAPEFKGMTTCESADQVRERNAKKGLKPRLVPATGGVGQ